jgi:hypothetical protein
MTINFCSKTINLKTMLSTYFFGLKSIKTKTTRPVAMKDEYLGPP